MLPRVYLLTLQMSEGWLKAGLGPRGRGPRPVALVTPGGSGSQAAASAASTTAALTKSRFLSWGKSWRLRCGFGAFLPPSGKR